MASPMDLTTLADVKAWIGITSTADDVVLAGLVTDISVAILADLGRAGVLPATYAEMRDGCGETAIVLRAWPVATLITLAIDGITVSIASGVPPAGGVAAVLDSADPAPPGGAQRVSLSCGSFPRGVRNVAITYRAGYAIVGETVAVPAVAPFTVTARAPYGAWGSDEGVTYAGGGAMIAATTPAAGAYAVAQGVYTFGAADAGASVGLAYGYTPADLSHACREWVAERYAYRARIGQSSKSLGGQETAAFIVKAMPDMVDRLLRPYRRVVGP